jgi:ribonuclease-3
MKFKFFKGIPGQGGAAVGAAPSPLVIGTGTAENGRASKTAPVIAVRTDFEALESAIGYSFKDRTLLIRALTHRSASANVATAPAASEAGPVDYERLEFLGDAVLDLATAHHLIEGFPIAREGELSKMRAALVNTAALAGIAREIKLGEFIRLSRSEAAAGGNDRESILADVLEALMGSIYREAGFDIAREVAARLLGARLTTVSPSDPKTELQELLHASGSTAPEYLVEFTEGPEHSPVYVSIVKIDQQIVGRGRGRTKKESQQAAAAEALSILRGRDEIDAAALAIEDGAKVAK